MDEAALRALIDDLAGRRRERRRGRRPSAAAAVRRHRRRPRRPPPGAAPGHARGDLRARQDGRAVRADRRRVARPRCRSGAADARRRRPDQGRAWPLMATPSSSGRSVLWRRPEVRADRSVLVVTAGTADSPVADEAAITLAAHGLAADRLHDVGVAGIHRLLAHVDRVTAADAVIVVAGMEGALASVVGGLTGVPVVAVPTSVGLRRRARWRDRAAGDARLVRQRRHRGRHRQRVRCRLCGGEDAAPGDAFGLVQLLRRCRRRHAAGVVDRRRCRPGARSPMRGRGWGSTGRRPPGNACSAAA